MQVKFLKADPSATIPKYQTKGASGFDLHSIEDVVLKCGETHIVNTGLKVEIPRLTELQIRPRSGLSAKTGLRIANAPGTIDEDYRGVLKVIVHNAGEITEIISKGDRIAQGVICPVFKPEIIEVEELSSSERGSGGFGSTGIK